MDAKIKLDLDNSVMRVTFSGIFDIEQYQEFYVALVNHKDFTPGMNMIWDVTELNISMMNTALVKEIGAVSILNAKRRGRGKTAFVVGTDFQFGTARMFDSLLKNSIPAIFRPFKTPIEAERWIQSGDNSDDQD